MTGEAARRADEHARKLFFGIIYDGPPNSVAHNDYMRAMKLAADALEKWEAEAVRAERERWMLYVGQPGDPTYEELWRENRLALAAAAMTSEVARRVDSEHAKRCGCIDAVHSLDWTNWKLQQAEAALSAVQAQLAEAVRAERERIAAWLETSYGCNCCDKRYHTPHGQCPHEIATTLREEPRS